MITGVIYKCDNCGNEFTRNTDRTKDVLTLSYRIEGPGIKFGFADKHFCCIDCFKRGDRVSYEEE